MNYLSEDDEAKSCVFDSECIQLYHNKLIKGSK